MKSVEFGKMPDFYTEKEKEVCSQIYEAINGLQYEDVDSEIMAVRELASLNDIVIIYPQSDDLILFEGAIIDETDCYDSCSIPLDENGHILASECADECCPYFQEKLEKSAVKVTADFDSTEGFFVTCENGVYFSMIEGNELIARGVIVPRRFLRG